MLLAYNVKLDWKNNNHHFFGTFRQEVFGRRNISILAFVFWLRCFQAFTIPLTTSGFDDLMILGLEHCQVLLR